MIYTVCDMARSSVDLYGQKTALIDGTERLSYSDLVTQALALSVSLRERGVKKGDRVAMFLPRSTSLVVSLFGTWFAGAIGVILNETLRINQISHVLHHSEASLLITTEKMLYHLPQQPFPPGKTFRLDEHPLQSRHGDPVPVIGADLALLIYTSGSTGMPKGIMITHDNLISGTRIISDYLKLTHKDTLISLLPFSFDYGLNQLMTSLYVGGTLVITRSVLLADICKLLVEEKVTGMAAVPYLWQQLVQPRSPFLSTKLPHLRYITNTGGKMPEQVTRLIRSTHPHVSVYLMFGLTEAFRSTYLPPDQVDIRPTSIGKAIPNNEIMVINEKGELCKPGETGELLHRGATVSRGYWKDPEKTVERFRPNPFQIGEGGITEMVVFSGDYVKLDDEGYIYFIGRKDQLIKSKGLRVSPEEVEEPLLASNMLMSAAVFSVDRNEADSEIVAAVIPKDHTTFNEASLREYCKVEMPDYMRPRVFWTVTSFPTTSTGKPDRNRVKEQFLESQKSGS